MREDVLQQEILSSADSENVESAAEKRQHARVPVSIGVEIFDSRTGTRIIGRATDVGVGGCYVDTTSTLAQSTPVEITLQWQGRALHMRALVSYVANGRSIGMGLSFIGASAEAGATLLEWITGLSADPARNPSRAPAPNAKAVSEDGVVGSQDLKTTVGELLTLLVQKRVLTKTEGARLSDMVFGQQPPGSSL
jgi:hypothetical protein